MKTVQGDLIKLSLDNHFDVILHGCNCFCAMGAGIAKQIKKELPEAWEADLRTTKGDRSKLGTYSQATIIRPGAEFLVLNAYTQFHWRGKGVKVDYTAVRDVFRRVASEFPDKRIAFPAIGAGYAGGNWGRLSSIIKTELNGLDSTFVEFDPG